jgi:hypothetical protein
MGGSPGRTDTEKRIDRFLLGGCLLMGLAFTCLFGVLMILYGLYLENQHRKLGRVTRPMVITLIAVFGISNGIIELFSAHGMLFASSNPFFMPMVEVYGVYIDERYWGYGYNGEWWGGPDDRYETTWNITTGFFLFSFYTVAHYGLYRMTRWGLRWSLITSWLFAFGCIHYAINHSISLHANTLSAEFPVWGWALVNYPYNMTPFLALFVLHAANVACFRDEDDPQRIAPVLTGEEPG